LIEIRADIKRTSDGKNPVPGTEKNTGPQGEAEKSDPNPTASATGYRVHELDTGIEAKLGQLEHELDEIFYVDGPCFGNGTDFSTGAWAVIAERNPELGATGYLPEASNQKAEIEAAIQATFQKRISPQRDAQETGITSVHIPAHLRAVGLALLLRVCRDMNARDPQETGRRNCSE